MRTAEGGNRTHTPLRERDFESRASANSATSAGPDSDRLIAFRIRRILPLGPYRGNRSRGAASLPVRTVRLTLRRRFRPYRQAADIITTQDGTITFSITTLSALNRRLPRAFSAGYCSLARHTSRRNRCVHIPDTVQYHPLAILWRKEGGIHSQMHREGPADVSRSGQSKARRDIVIEP